MPTGIRSKQELQATYGRVLVTVKVRSNGLSADRRRDLATALAGAYLSGR